MDDSILGTLLIRSLDTDTDSPNMSTSTPEMLIAFDFDHTLIDLNSDLVLFDKLPCGQPLRPRFKELHQQGMKWTQIMQTLLAELAKQEGYGKEDVLALLRDIKMDPVLISALRQLRSSLGSALKMIIASDANTIFIGEILRANGLDDGIFDRVYTNPASWTDEDVIELEPYQPVSTPHGCRRTCNPNMCKSAILRSARHDMGLKTDVYTVFVGDGSNDFCPSLSLSAVDLVLARDAFALQKLIAAAMESTEEGADKLLASFKLWKTQRELGDVLLQLPRSASIQSAER